MSAVSPPEPGEYHVSNRVWVETVKLTDGSLVFNVWARNDALRANGRGEDRVRFLIEPTGDDPWLTWALADAFARRVNGLIGSVVGWDVLEGRRS